MSVNRKSSGSNIVNLVSPPSTPIYPTLPNLALSLWGEGCLSSLEGGDGDNKETKDFGRNLRQVSPFLFFILYSKIILSFE